MAYSITNSITSEFDFINSLVKNKINDKNIICSIGDDCAVLKHTKQSHLIITTDMIVENVHFSLKWHTPFQIGSKLLEVNVSDIISMGGTPKYAFLSMCLPGNTSNTFINDFLKGLYKSAAKHKVLLIGGDTTHGSEYVFNITLLGEVDKKLLCLRSMALPGDIVCVTGKLGSSEAGLNLLLSGKKGYIDDYLNPCTRIEEEGKIIAEFANAMIDISDGLGSEIKHICNNSNVGAYIECDKIPISENTLKTAKLLNKDPYDFALYGGEDFELLFTIKRTNVDKLRSCFTDFTEIGEIHSKTKGIYLIRGNKKLKIKQGFDHFKK